MCHFRHESGRQEIVRPVDVAPVFGNREHDLEIMPDGRSSLGRAAAHHVLSPQGRVEGFRHQGLLEDGPGDFERLSEPYFAVLEIQALSSGLETPAAGSRERVHAGIPLVRVGEDPAGTPPPGFAGFVDPRNYGGVSLCLREISITSSPYSSLKW